MSWFDRLDRLEKADPAPLGFVVVWNRALTLLDGDERMKDKCDGLCLLSEDL